MNMNDEMRNDRFSVEDDRDVPAASDLIDDEPRERPSLSESVAAIAKAMGF
jgi:hypothetical protein